MGPLVQLDFSVFSLIFPLWPTVSSLGPSFTAAFLLLLSSRLPGSLLPAPPSSHCRVPGTEFLTCCSRLISAFLCHTEGLFPVDIGSVKKDPSFLDEDSLGALCR